MATTHVSQKEENFMRMQLLLKRISTRALFDKEFHPSCLNASIKRSEYTKLKDLKSKRIITAAQWKLLFPCNGR